MEPVGRSLDVEENRLEISARDGYRLGATLFMRARQGDPADAVVFNAGGGLSTVRYRYFLHYLAAEGFPVLAYDYRGVGMSSPASWRDFDAGIEDWTEFDQAGAIDALRARFPAARLTSVSHSIGCMFAAAAPNAPSLCQMVFIAPHTAYCGDYKQPAMAHDAPVACRDAGDRTRRRLFSGQSAGPRGRLPAARRATVGIEAYARLPTRRERRRRQA